MIRTRAWFQNKAGTVVYAFALIFYFRSVQNTNAQPTLRFADSIGRVYRIPELGYAVISSSKIHEIKTTGVRKINTSLLARPWDRFRIGSNTKAITGFIAAGLVKQKKMNWDTKFFDLFPELKQGSHPAYSHLTLLNLLSFRTRLFPYTYTYPEPTKDQFTGNEEQQRYQFVKWFFQHEPVSDNDSIHFSNLGYVAAGLMLEKASGKSYKELVIQLGNELGINFGFGSPNETDSLQTWGHNQDLIPEKPENNFKLNWLLPAGNINVSLPDYAKFIQLQLKGFKGQSEILSKQEFEFLHYGLPRFSIGWNVARDEKNRTYSFHVGNPGTFLTKVYIFKDADLAIILFANAQTEDSNRGLDILYAELIRKYKP